MEVYFKRNLRDQLDYLGMTIQELSDKTGISKRTIENYLSKRGSIPPADYAYLISKALGVSMEWLVAGNDSETDTKQWCASKMRPLMHDIEKLDTNVQEAIKTIVRAVLE